MKENIMGIDKSGLEDDVRLIRDLKTRDGSESSDHFTMTFTSNLWFDNLQLEPNWKRHFIDKEKRKKLYMLYDALKMKADKNNQFVTAMALNLYQELDIPESTIKKYLSQLVEMNLLTKPKHGAYQLTDLSIVADEEEEKY